MEINSRIAVVTGASRGLGAAVSAALVKAGAVVYGLARNEEKLEELRAQLGENFVPVILDLGEQNTIEEWVKKTFSEEHSPDILINNAGAGYFGKIDELPTEKWRQMMNINLNAVYYLCAAIVPFLKLKKSSSHIVNIGSILGKMSAAEKSAYSASKYAIQGFSEALFKELRYDNIKVTCINPGSIDTWFFEESGVEPHHNMLQPKEISEVILNVIKTPDNVLIDELTIRPLNPKP